MKSHTGYHQNFEKFVDIYLVNSFFSKEKTQTTALIILFGMNKAQNFFSASLNKAIDEYNWCNHIRELCIAILLTYFIKKIQIWNILAAFLKQSCIFFILFRTKLRLNDNLEST